MIDAHFLKHTVEPWHVAQRSSPCNIFTLGDLPHDPPGGGFNLVEERLFSLTFL
jgi:hypothetical protein